MCGRVCAEKRHSPSERSRRSRPSRPIISPGRRAPSDRTAFEAQSRSGREGGVRVQTVVSSLSGQISASKGTKRHAYSREWRVPVASPADASATFQALTRLHPFMAPGVLLCGGYITSWRLKRRTQPSPFTHKHEKEKKRVSRRIQHGEELQERASGGGKDRRVEVVLVPPKYWAFCDRDSRARWQGVVASPEGGGETVKGEDKLPLSRYTRAPPSGQQGK